MRRCLLNALVVATAIGCTDRNPAAPSSSLTPRFNINAPPASARTLTVMSQNLYVGADVDAVIQALLTENQGDDLAALLVAIETVGKTAFPARAEAIADEIARARPHAIGLQEVSQIDIDLRGLGVPVLLSQNFLALLQAALTRRGLHYTVAATSTNVNVNLVFGSAPNSGSVRLIDQDALLVDADRVTVNAASGQTFTANVGSVGPITLIRGWVRARVSIAGEPYTIISAHTEANLSGAPFDVGLLRAAQVGEMIASVGANERVVLMGDLNDAPGSPMYNLLLAAGFTDTWSAVYPGTSGLTCCHASDLSDAVATFDQRIDYVFTRGFARTDGKVFAQIDRFGEVPADRLAGPAYPIWPSDHVGLIAALR